MSGAPTGAFLWLHSGRSELKRHRNVERRQHRGHRFSEASEKGSRAAQGLQVKGQSLGQRGGGGQTVGTQYSLATNTAVLYEHVRKQGLLGDFQRLHQFGSVTLSS